jgi:hypothetical protein
VRRKTCADRIVGRTRRGRTCIDDHVHGGQRGLVQSKVFAHEPLQMIAAHGIAGCLDADRESEARVPDLIRARDHEEQRIGVTLATRVDDVELWLVS